MNRAFFQAIGYLKDWNMTKIQFVCGGEMDGVDVGYKEMVLDKHVVELGMFTINKVE